jgi:DNA-binding CsgD family transcriptional regulator
MRPFWAPQRWDEQRLLAEEFTTHRPEGLSPRALRGVLRRSQLIYLAAGERARADEVRGDLDEFASRAGDAVLLLWPLEVEALLATLDGQLEMAVAAAERFRARADELGMSMHGRFTAHGLTWRPLLYLGRTGASPAGSDGETSEDQLISRRVEALVCLAHGGPTSELRDELRRLLQRIDPMYSEEAPADWLGKLLEASLLLDDRDAIARLVPKLDGIVATNDLFSVNNVARQVGAAYALLEDRTAATAQYQRALEWATKIRFRPEIALTRLALAELLADGDAQQRSESRGHLDFAVEEFRTMNMRPALERALRLQAGQPGRAAPRARPVYPGGLSEREVEVLRLVAGGKSNRDIAAMLVISLSTVAHHVSSVLAKTDAANRAEAASYATRHGLV